MAEKETVVGADSTATYEPVVQLQEVEVDTGEKDEECIYKQRCALFRFASECEPQAWKERGKGDIKFLKHKQTGAIRIVMRQEKTLKLVLNHIIHPLNELKPNSGSDRFWTWRSRDFSSDEPVTDTFGLRFKTAEIANEFKKEYDNSRDKNATRKIGTTEKTELKRKEEVKAPATATTATTTAAVSSPAVSSPFSSSTTTAPAASTTTPAATVAVKEEGKEAKKKKKKKKPKKKTTAEGGATKSAKSSPTKQ